MLNVTDIKNIKFSNAINGYKKEEVEILLDKIEVDFSRYERVISERDAKINELEGEIQNLKNSQDSIQNVLLSAQRLADQIVEEAKQKSEQIVKDAENSISMISEREKQLTFAFEQKANERKSAFESEMEVAINDANARKQAIEKATAQSVEKQQEIFDRIKQEISDFKALITEKYREHLKLLSEIPDAVPIEPKNAAEIASEQYENRNELKSVGDEEETLPEENNTETEEE